MTLRIIGGVFRNRPLLAPKGGNTRPTLAIMRKAVFDILQNAIQDARFLDLFAGSGLMGLEALSRGAQHVIFVENNCAAACCIKENVHLLKLDAQAEIVSLDAMDALVKCTKRKRFFDVIYVDPPYILSKTTSILQEVLLFVDAHNLLAPQGILFIETAKSGGFSPTSIALTHLHWVNTRKFSDSLLHQYRVQETGNLLTERD